MQAGTSGRCRIPHRILWIHFYRTFLCLWEANCRGTPSSFFIHTGENVCGNHGAICYFPVALGSSVVSAGCRREEQKEGKNLKEDSPVFLASCECLSAAVSPLFLDACVWGLSLMPVSSHPSPAKWGGSPSWCVPRESVVVRPGPKASSPCVKSSRSQERDTQVLCSRHFSEGTCQV